MGWPKQVPLNPLKRWEVLAGLVQKQGWTRGAEIGVLNGATFFHLLDTCPDLHMVAVDQWAANDPVYPDLPMEGSAFVLRAAGYGDRARILKGPSVEMARFVPDGSLDFCFIDADHSMEAVRADIQAWGPKVRKGGVIMGHDIDHGSVRTAVREELCSFTELQDDVWAVLKVGTP